MFRDPATTPESDTMLREKAHALLVQAGISEPRSLPFIRIQRLLGGANNAVYRFEMPGRSLLLKHYFAAPADGRDRFGAEVAFVQFAWQHGIRAVPQLLASSREERLGLFEFIEGRPIAASEIDARLLQQAVRFCQQLQVAQAIPAALSIGSGAEACFSIQEHLACVESRLARLQAIVPESDELQEALQFVRRELAPRWSIVRTRVLAKCHEAGVAPAQVLAADERCLSPSDFGFHNALLDHRGVMRFFDFEYAGWDDPAKLVCDFFCQVEIPVPALFLPSFAQAIAGRLPCPERILIRIEWLRPLYKLKWCCIVLNECLPAGQARRRFSAGELQPGRRLENQLRKARGIVADLDADLTRS